MKNILLTANSAISFNSLYRLLSKDLIPLYPGFTQWLEQKVESISKGKAHCTTAWYRNDLVGALISTPKGNRIHKISTLYIRNRYQRLGIGSELLKYQVLEYERIGVTSCYITLTERKLEYYESLFKMNEFSFGFKLEDRYIDGANELIFKREIQ